MTKNTFIRLGLRLGWGGVEAPFRISPDALGHHLYIVGKTGTGKSTLLKSICLQLAESQRGFALLDPHGSLAGEILDSLPSHFRENVAVLDLSDLEFPAAWNFVAGVSPNDRHKAADGIVAAFKHIWGDISWGPRLEDIFRNGVRALLDADHTTILGLSKLLTDEEYRHWVMRQIKDPAILSFWRDEFEEYDKRYRQEAIAPILNKVRMLSTNPVLRNIVGQMKRKLDISSIIEDGRVLIANLSKAEIGTEAANLIGSLLVAEFERLALERARVPASERKSFALIVDEFQNYGTRAFVSILSEARKFNLSLIAAHQYCAQVRDDVRQAILGNVGTIISFRLGYNDAVIMANEYGQNFAPVHFVDLDRFNMLVKPCLADGSDLPFRAKTEPVLPPNISNRAKIVRASRSLYCPPRSIVEERIFRWMSRWGTDS